MISKKFKPDEEPVEAFGGGRVLEDQNGQEVSGQANHAHNGDGHALNPEPREKIV